MIIEQHIKDELNISGLVSFNTFLNLLEGIGPKKIDYGTNYPDFDDGVFDESVGADVTFIQNEKYIYRIAFEGYKNYPDVSFSTIIKSDVESVKDLNSGEYVLGKKSLHSDTLYIFNYVVYVLVEYIKERQPDGFTISAASPKLDKLYDRLVKNTQFIKTLNTQGYQFDRKNIDYHFLRNTYEH